MPSGPPAITAAERADYLRIMNDPATLHAGLIAQGAAHELPEGCPCGACRAERTFRARYRHAVRVAERWAPYLDTTTRRAAA